MASVTWSVGILPLILPASGVKESFARRTQTVIWKMPNTSNGSYGTSPVKKVFVILVVRETISVRLISPEWLRNVSTSVHVLPKIADPTV